MSRNRRLLVLVALALVAGATWLGVRAYQAESHMSSARTAVEQARADLLDRKLDAAGTDLRRAASETAAAKHVTRDPIWRITSHLPFLGRSFRTVSALASASDTLTQDTLPTALREAERLDPKRLRRPDGSIDLSVLRSAAPGLRRAAQSSAEADAAGRRAPASMLLPGVAGARREFLASSSHLTSALVAARRAVDLAPVLLGDGVTRRYFVAVQQNAESRGTGGLIGGYAILQARDGRIRVLEQGTDRDLFGDTRAINPPADLPNGFTQAYGFYSVFSQWVNINLPPHLPAVASLIKAKWAARTGQQLDGVIALDGNALQDILIGSPPLRIGDKTVQPEHLADYLAIGQYEGRSLDPVDTNERKDSLEEVAGTVLRRLTASGSDSDALIRGLIRAVRSGHLRMASPEPALAGLHEAGVDGATPSGPAPVAYPVIYNAQGSKLDLWLHRTVHWSCGSNGRVTVTVDLRADTPAGPLPQYVALDVRQNPKVRVTRTDAVHLDLYVTRGARLVAASRDGTPLKPVALTHGVVDGLPFWGTDFELPPGQKHTFSLVLDKAGTPGDVRIPEQPLAQPLVRDVRDRC
ncbi:MAG: DUF4012 domain-containing protein [Mycobacteriales bacterium]